MTFYQSAEQKNYINQLEELTKKFAVRAQELDESRSFPFQNISDLKQFGYTKLTLPKEYGGLGGSLYDFLLGQEKIAQACGPTALGIGWHVGITHQLSEKRHWEKDVLDEVLIKIGDGALINSAATEAKTGSPTRGGRPGTIARRSGNHWVISGRKTFTTLAPVLDLIQVSAWVEEEEGIGWFLIDRNQEGISFEDTWDMVSMQGTASQDLILDSVKVENKYFVEKPGKRKSIGEGWLLHIPACYIGIAGAARNYAIDFAKTYSPNSLNGPIRDLANVQRLAGEIELEYAQARHFLYSVAEKWENKDNRPELSRELGAVKTAVTNSAITIVDKAMRIVGAKSLQRSSPLQRIYRDVRAGLHNPPMDDTALTTMAKTVLYD
ncbi:alkylation response protein AidB-like acyl-CoA dehydrogenase [Peribacillus deserti]|uniref:Alkylation response protein AidB-like acyl-CoA dehydrogenase n=1 Tax=Peribacillus deserti TaxID=673318 RepID=A0ABS2QDV5_9BACI|nr:acyl-CoA dehydrogenase family protein [Peribacillus deserti]MBM7691340.1 alkylation response protein AidB-like acyl-CoA dehydrogenase [Peribacillus deserti]